MELISYARVLKKLIIHSIENRKLSLHFEEIPEYYFVEFFDDSYMPEIDTKEEAKFRKLTSPLFFEEDVIQPLNTTAILEYVTLSFKLWYTCQKFVFEEPSDEFDKLYIACVKIYQELNYKEKLFIDSTKRFGYFYSIAFDKKLPKKLFPNIAKRLFCSPDNLYSHYNEGRKLKLGNKRNKAELHVIEEIKPLLKYIPK